MTLHLGLRLLKCSSEESHLSAGIPDTNQKHQHLPDTGVMCQYESRAKMPHCSYTGSFKYWSNFSAEPQIRNPFAKEGRRFGCLGWVVCSPHSSSEQMSTWQEIATVTHLLPSFVKSSDHKAKPEDFSKDL